MSGTERALSYLNFAAQIVLLWRLVHANIHRTYGFLFWYWVAQALGTMALLYSPINTYQYLYIYWATQTVTILLAIMVVQDLYRITFLEHPAVASFARRSVFAALAIAAAVALSGIR